MTEDEVLSNAFAMPLLNPAFPPGPYRFVDREYLIITYRTDPARLRAMVPAPLEVDEPVVKYEFIRMPDSTGFGDYTETGQVIPVRFQGRKGGYTLCMFLNDHPPIAGGRARAACPGSASAGGATTVATEDRSGSWQAAQWAISTGISTSSMMSRVTPPSTHSLSREWP